MIINRRKFIQKAGVTIATFSVFSCAGEDTGALENIIDIDEDIDENIDEGEDPITQSNYRMPDESEPHSVTWMAYGATADAWGTTGVYGNSRSIARKDLIRIAANISRFEPVKMLVSNVRDRAEAELFLAEIKNETVNTSIEFVPGQAFTGGRSVPAIEAGGSIEFIIQPVDDLWMRDTGPVFVWDSNNNLSGVNFNFNGWGQEDTGAEGWTKDPNKAANGVVDQSIWNDQQVADFVLVQADAVKLETTLVSEGGCLEVNGQGTAICTESCILNDNRNPGVSKEEIEDEFEKLLGVRKVIWLQGIKAKEITDGHVDFYARFVGHTSVMYALDLDPESPDYSVTLANKIELQAATDADGHPLTTMALESPDFFKVQEAVESRNWGTTKYFNFDGFAAGYIGFYVANNCVILSQFGDDDADIAAFDKVQAAFPDRTVIQITTDGIANGGGSIHCATQQQIALS